MTIFALTLPPRAQTAKTAPQTFGATPGHRPDARPSPREGVPQRPGRHDRLDGRPATAQTGRSTGSPRLGRRPHRVACLQGRGGASC